jgi:leader peptidase (prepilin peptidase)/N-methyltransferase
MPVEGFIIAMAAVLGAAVGSFLNVCILRLPRDESLLHPRSRCPSCGYQLAWFDNVPVVSWLVLGGRCRRCRTPISLQYPLIELLVSLIWAAAFWYYGFDLSALAAALFGTMLLGVGVTDARHYLIPDEYTVGGLVLGLLLALRGGLPGLWSALLGAGVGFGILWFVAWAGSRVLGKEAMGGGDVKMMAMVGAFVGWKGVLLTIFGGSLLGTLIFIPLNIRRKALVPFGVFLAAAAAIVFVFGDRILAWYLSLVT